MAKTLSAKPRSNAVIMLLLALVAQALTQTLVANDAAVNQNSIDKLFGKLADKFAEKVMDRAFKRLPLNRADLDGTTLAKSHSDASVGRYTSHVVHAPHPQLPVQHASFVLPSSPLPIAHFPVHVSHSLRSINRGSLFPAGERYGRRFHDKWRHYVMQRDVYSEVDKQLAEIELPIASQSQSQIELQVSALAAQEAAAADVKAAATAARAAYPPPMGWQKSMEQQLTAIEKQVAEVPIQDGRIAAAAVRVKAEIKAAREEIAAAKEVEAKEARLGRSEAATASVAANCQVMCQGKLLEEVQTLNDGRGLFADSKYFVDMPMLSDPEDVTAAFDALPRQEDGTLMPGVLEEFIEKNFAPAATDLEEVDPKDWQASPAFLAEVRNETLRDWARDVHALWRVLVRRPVHDVLDHQQRHTLLWTPHPIVVPGGRFRESYYWDSYWIVQGLLVSEMPVTAHGVVENLLSFCERFGFVPNGGRSYYLHRSQPPMLSEMVRVLVEDFQRRGKRADARRLIQRSLPVLEKEHRFWLENRTVSLEGDALLSHYDSGNSVPRPESFREDVALSKSVGPSRNPSSLFREIAAAAESGWDFSSRWFVDGESMSSIDTTKVFPVDLNAMLLRMELNLRNMHLSLGNASGAGIYGSFAKSRFAAMNRFMWSETDGFWRDISRELLPTKHGVFKAASNFIPLWALARMDDAVFLGADATQVAMAVAALNSSGLIRSGGVVTTSDMTGEQWDSPNAWAPIQQMLIEGLVGGLARDQGGADIGKKIAKAWIETNFAAWQKHRFMYEKYDADVVGSGGGGGEYIPQTGFGWSNGVALQLLSEFYSNQKSIDSQVSTDPRLYPQGLKTLLNAKVPPKQVLESATRVR